MKSRASCIYFLNRPQNLREAIRVMCTAPETDPRMAEPQPEWFHRFAGSMLMPFISYSELTNEQQRCVKTRREPTAETTLKAFAFWIMPNGGVAHYGMCHLPVAVASRRQTLQADGEGT
jgi:hypothetical protein